jgi:hypothetical protein
MKNAEIQRHSHDRCEKIAIKKRHQEFDAMEIRILKLASEMAPLVVQEQENMQGYARIFAMDVIELLLHSPSWDISEFGIEVRF